MGAHGTSTRAAEVSRLLGENAKYPQKTARIAGSTHPKPDDAATIDGRFGRHLLQVGRRALLERLVDDRRHFLAMTAQQQKIDQAVLQRRPAVLDRFGGKNRIDAVHQRRQQPADESRNRPRPAAPPTAGGVRRSPNRPPPPNGRPAPPPAGTPTCRRPASSGLRQYRPL